MPATSLVDQLRGDFPEFHFEKGEVFHWSPTQKTVVYADVGNTFQLLHELGHGLLGHQTYTHDIELVRMERDAWERAREIATRYDIVIDDETIETALDTYRDWLHARSTCPNCQATGVQKGDHEYRCLACGTVWRVNDARLCGLRRYVTNKK